MQKGGRRFLSRLSLALSLPLSLSLSLSLSLEYNHLLNVTTAHLTVSLSVSLLPTLIANPIIKVEESLACRLSTHDLFSDKVPLKHIFSNQLKEMAAGQPSSRGRMLRIRQEMATLSDSLPPGIHVAFDETRFDCLRAMIVGAEGTPYANGCFFFDLYIPSNYPQVPPGCKIITTGKGKFRFNPNLYSNGKVCLSLLGTWAGPGWDPQLSTLFQVLLSIQAMVMCADPIQNEPSWEYKVGTPEGERFDRAVQHGTLLYAMLDHLKDPPYGFEQVTHAHFWLHKQDILQQIREWRAFQASPCSAKVNCNYGREDTISAVTFEDTANELEALLTELPKPHVSVDSDTDTDSDSD